MIGLVLTGTRGAGKSTTAEILSRTSAVRQVPAITTRAPRPDDADGAYTYVSRGDLELLEREGGLLIQAEYAGNLYGIARSAIQRMLKHGVVPCLVVTPEAAKRIGGQPGGDEWVIVYLDASDELLDARLSAQDRSPTDRDIEQRRIDRQHVPPSATLISAEASPDSVARQVLDALDAGRNR